MRSLRRINGHFTVSEWIEGVHFSWAVDGQDHQVVFNFDQNILKRHRVFHAKSQIRLMNQAEVGLQESAKMALAEEYF
jgi:hypothetical protein